MTSNMTSLLVKTYRSKRLKLAEMCTLLERL